MLAAAYIADGSLMWIPVLAATKHVQDAVESYKAELKSTLGQMNTLKQVRIRAEGLAT